MALDRELAFRLPMLTGDDVRRVQQALARAGVLSATGADGIFGPGTREAVIAFQRQMAARNPAITVDGIVGRDTLLEYEGDGFYEPLDLCISPCRLSVAGRDAALLERGRLRVATKYPAITRRHFARKGVQTEIIKLYGSMELAPLVGLADCIVDLVDTGNTLRANGLLELEEICRVTSRLIINKAAMKTRHATATRLISLLEAQLPPA